MSHPANLVDQIRKQWDQRNAEGAILYSADTLQMRTIRHKEAVLHLIHNACRDVYDRSPRSIDKPVGAQGPFSDGSNPELVRTDDRWFKVLGNRFACMQYQSILVPIETQAVLTPSFLEASLRFAIKHPALTLMYNAINAGKTIPHQFWLLSLHTYKTLEQALRGNRPLGIVRGLLLQKREAPCYMITFDIRGDSEVAADILYKLTCFMDHRDFNVFIFANHIYFIPRESIEVPVGFENHRFGGLEMIGYFVMKSAEALESADPVVLLGGIRQISYRPANQDRLERYLLHELR